MIKSACGLWEAKSGEQVRDFIDDERNLYGIIDDTPTCPQFAGD